MTTNENSYEPKVSIIIPVYNTDKYLRRCLASVCGQLLKEIEIICVNDGSTDNSVGILNDFAQRDNRIKIINQNNSGVANARNNGIKIANAPYIGFVDSDDFIAPDMYEKMYNAMTGNDVDFVECGAEPFFTYDFHDKEGQRKYLSNDNLSGIVKDPNLFIDTSGELWKLLFKKELINKYQLEFPEGFCSSDDTLFVILYKSILQSGFYIQENLYMYISYEDSIMGKTYKKKQDRIKESFGIINPYYLFLKKYNIYEQWKDFFWDFFVSRVSFFYEWAAPEIIRSFSIDLIGDLLEIEDISKLAKEKYKKFLVFKWAKTSTLLKLSCFLSNKKKTFRKACKNVLPYGIVCRIQKIKNERKKKAKGNYDNI
jgi:glycosyltransferase involved in cell wall biosynthesis